MLKVMWLYLNSSYKCRVGICVRISHQNPLLVVKGNWIGTILRMRPQNPRLCVTASVTWRGSLSAQRTEALRKGFNVALQPRKTYSLLCFVWGLRNSLNENWFCLKRRSYIDSQASPHGQSEDPKNKYSTSISICMQLEVKVLMLARVNTLVKLDVHVLNNQELL